MTTNDELCRRLLEWAADEDNVVVYDSEGGWCVFCEAERTFTFQPHADDCLHLAAKAAVAARDGGEGDG